MLALRGTYLNGKLQLEKPVVSKNELKVIVTFLQQPDTLEINKVSLSEKLKKGPVMTESQYKEYLEGKAWMNETRLVK